MTLSEQVQTIYQLLSDDRIEKLGLFRIDGAKTVTPRADDTISMFTHRSKRSDHLTDQSLVEDLLSAIKAGPKYNGVNHIGFCYKVSSKEDEISRIAHEASNKGFSAYQEPSNDDAAWIFVGDLSDISNPLLEFVPLEDHITDKWVDYWLPHIQFDIDTGLSPSEIKTLVNKVMRRPYTPYPIQIDGVTYIQRVNIGCIEGVNLMLDLSTNYRDINHRKTWNKLT